MLKRSADRKAGYVLRLKLLLLRVLPSVQKIQNVFFRQFSGFYITGDGLAVPVDKRAEVNVKIVR